MAARGLLPEEFAAILEEVAAGEGATKALDARKISPRVFWGHLATFPAAAEAYAHARARGVDRKAEEIEAIADDATLEADDKRIRIDTRKWLLSKIAPKRYGDLLHLQHSGSIDLATELEAARKRRASDDEKSGRTQPPASKSEKK